MATYDELNDDLKAIVDKLSTLTVMEAADLASALEDHWGVEAASGGGGMMMMAAPAEGAGAAAEEKTEFDVILADAGALTLVPTFACFNFIACLIDPIDHRL